MWLILIGIVVVLGIYKFVNCFRYWEDKGVPSPSVLSCLKSMRDGFLRNKPMAELMVHYYNEFPGSRYSGNFSGTEPLLTLRDPEIIKQITVKDFDFFTDHMSMMEEHIEPLWGKNLVQLQGDRWRNMRATLSPAFTSSKMKNMFVFISECAEQFAEHFHKQGEESLSLEMKDIFSRYANDIIASTAFGIKCDSLADSENEFYVMGKDLTDISGMKFFWMMLYMLMPSLHKITGGSIFSEPVKKFFRTSVKETMEQRERERIIRPDMIHLMMEARKGRLEHDEGKENKDAGFATVEESNVGKEQKSGSVELSDDDITAQAMIFFFAGFDTVSALMSFMAYELALNPDIQQRLQMEVDDTLQQCNGKLTYDALLKMKYMDMVVSETLRKWPSAITLDRLCTKDYILQPSKPDEQPIPIRKGILMFIPVYALHRDPQYFPEPERFDPERFSDENKHNIQPFSYLPFGTGPRNCIGSRFALLESKAVMFHLLTKFTIAVNEKTEIPLQLSKKDFSMASANGIWLSFKRRTVDVKK